MSRNKIVKWRALLVLIVLLSPASPFSQGQGSEPTARKIPEAATIKITLLNTPGINVEGSRWEIAYEFRIANEASLWEAWKHRRSNGGSEQRVGEPIKEGVFSESLRSPGNREAVFRIPLGAEIQERLRAQPRERVKLVPGKVTPEDIRLSREQEAKAQHFLFYSTLNIYDAKLKKNFIIPASRSWDFGSFPDAQFEIRIEIHDNGSYNIHSSTPSKKGSN